MSFDVFIASFHEGKRPGFPRQCMRDAFGANIIEQSGSTRQSEAAFWRLRHDTGAECDMSLTADDTNPNMVTGFTIDRPCPNPRFWEGLAGLLASCDLVLHFPGGRAPLVTKIAVIQHLPADMIKALGQPLVISSGKEIPQEIATA